MQLPAFTAVEFGVEASEGSGLWFGPVAIAVKMVVGDARVVMVVLVVKWQGGCSKNLRLVAVMPRVGRSSEPT